jgi:mannosyl-3-phosphoglycerate phosphatase
MRTYFVIFSDLDGTLLDHHTYSFEAALPVLKKLKARKIPVVLTTSKTRAETEQICQKLGLNHPFIVENGGAIFIPAGYFNLKGMRTLRKGSYEVIPLGVSYRRIRRALKMIKDQTNVELVGLGDLKFNQVARISGLESESARLAKKREYDEPFILRHSGLIKKIRIRARELGLKVVKGGRFYHLIGTNDKGKAVRILKNLYEKKYGKIKCIGLGDSSNDFPMLKEVDFPVLIRRADGKYEKLPALKNLMKTGLQGSAGWAEAIIRIFNW